MTNAVIVSTARTPLAKSWRGAFNMTHGATLGGHAVKHAIARAGIGFVFTDGHALATPITAWFDDLVDLEKIDWPLVTQRYWQDSTHDMDRKRRKQAEFLVQHSCPWHCIERLVVINQAMKLRVENVLAHFPTSDHKNIEVTRDWYYHE